jgi:hypothetical protein
LLPAASVPAGDEVDHDVSPHVVFQHRRSAGWVTAGITAASLIAAPAKLKLHVAASNDPANPFVEYAMS